MRGAERGSSRPPRSAQHRQGPPEKSLGAARTFGGLGDAGEGQGWALGHSAGYFLGTRWQR